MSLYVYVLDIHSYAYGNGKPNLVEANNKGEVWRVILENRSTFHKHFEYLLFDTNKFQLVNHPEHVEFTIEPYSSLFGGSMSVKWTYQEFAEKIDGFKDKLVELGLGDDPFPSYNWNIDKIEIKDGDEYLLKKSCDHGAYTYRCYRTDPTAELDEFATSCGGFCEKNNNDSKIYYIISKISDLEVLKRR